MFNYLNKSLSSFKRTRYIWGDNSDTLFCLPSVKKESTLKGKNLLPLEEILNSTLLK